jgi:Sulfotransferase family
MLTRMIGGARLRSAAPPGPPAPFIIGVGRSGTTLLRMMLDAHPELAIPPETYFVPHLIAACGRLRLTPEDVLRTATEDEHRRWPDLEIADDRYLERLRALPRLNGADAVRAVFELYAAAAGKPRWGDKTPDYVKRMPEIKRALPEARFVHVIRDGRDVALSRWKRAVRGRAPAEKVARTWRRRINKARKQARDLSHYIEVRYEDLVTDTEPTLRRVCELIDLEFDPVMLRYYEDASQRLAEMARDLPDDGGGVRHSGSERMEAHALTSRPPTSERIAAWREEMSAEDRAAFAAVAGDLLAELGYDVEATPEKAG